VSAGGTARSVEAIWLWLDGEPAARLVRVEGDERLENDKGGEDLLLVADSLPPKLLSWIRSFINGKFKKRKVALVLPTKGTGPGTGKPRQYSRWRFSNVLIREVTFPALGSARSSRGGSSGSVFKLKLQYQKVRELTKQRVLPTMAGQPLRTEFFNLDLSGKDGKDTDGGDLSTSISSLGSFTVTRGTGSGYGSQSASYVKLTFPPRARIADAWRKWSTGKDKGRKRSGLLQLYHWTGMRYDRSEEGRGQLRALLALELNDVEIDRIDAGEGTATLKVDSMSMLERPPKPKSKPKPEPPEEPKPKKDKKKSDKK